MWPPGAPGPLPPSRSLCPPHRQVTGFPLGPRRAKPAAVGRRHLSVITSEFSPLHLIPETRLRITDLRLLRARPAVKVTQLPPDPRAVDPSLALPAAPLAPPGPGPGWWIRIVPRGITGEGSQRLPGQTQEATCLHFEREFRVDVTGNCSLIPSKASPCWGFIITGGIKWSQPRGIDPYHLTLCFMLLSQ